MVDYTKSKNKMKTKVITLMVAIVLMFGYTSCNAKAENNLAEKPTESVSKAEKATTMLTKEMFLEKVWDYENSPSGMEI